MTARSDAPREHPLASRAREMLDLWATETDPDVEAAAAESRARPTSTWDDIRIANAMQSPSDVVSVQRRVRLGPDNEPIRGNTVHAVETRAKGRSRPLADGHSPLVRWVDGIMTLVAEVSPAYRRAVRAVHQHGSERAAAEKLCEHRQSVGRSYEAGFAMFLREVIAVGGRPRLFEDR